MAEKTINVNLSTTMAGKMLHDKIKVNTEFALFVAEVLNSAYKLDYVIECAMSGISKPKWPVGTKLNCTYGKIGECKITAFLREEKYSQYEIEYTNKDGGISTTQVSEDVLEGISLIKDKP